MPVGSDSNTNSPRLTLVVVFYNMPREATRTLHTLSPAYQRDVSVKDYEVLIVDNGSTPPLDANWVRSLSPNFRCLRFDSSPSPVRAINSAMRQSTAPLVGVCIDGARMASPGLIAYALRASRIHDNPIIAPLAWHLGPEPQPLSSQRGYNQSIEDSLLESIPWQQDGYRLFDVASLAGSSNEGFFLPISECNSLFLLRSTYWSIGGFDEAFDMPGGGLANLDFYSRACALKDARLIVLLGEGTFHQFHGGVMTGSGKDKQKRFDEFLDQYQHLRKNRFQRPQNRIELFGHVPLQMSRFLRFSCETLERRCSPHRFDAPGFPKKQPWLQRLANFLRRAG